MNGYRCLPHFVGAGPCRGCGEFVSAVPNDPRERLHLVTTENGLAIYCPECCPVCGEKGEAKAE